MVAIMPQFSVCRLGFTSGYLEMNFAPIFLRYEIFFPFTPVLTTRF